MIQADLVVTDIAELATPLGNRARTGPELGQMRVIRDAAIACRGSEIVYVGTERELAQAVELPGDVERIDAGGGTALPGFVDAHTRRAPARHDLLRDCRPRGRHPVDRATHPSGELRHVGGVGARTP